MLLLVESWIGGWMVGLVSWTGAAGLPARCRWHRAALELLLQDALRCLSWQKVYCNGILIVLLCHLENKVAFSLRHTKLFTCLHHYITPFAHLRIGEHSKTQAPTSPRLPSSCKKPSSSNSLSKEVLTYFITLKEILADNHGIAPYTTLTTSIHSYYLFLFFLY